jgi:hypothetical protein
MIGFFSTFLSDVFIGCFLHALERKMIGERAARLVKEIDIGLNRIGEALQRAQPPYTGKLVLIWVDEGAELKTPVIKKLTKTRTGKFLAQAVPHKQLGKRASWRSSFSINHEYVKDLLQRAEYLLEKRKAINIKLRQARHWELLFCRENEPKVKQELIEADNLYAQIEDNLRGRPTRKSKLKEKADGTVETIVMDTKESAMKSRKRKPKELVTEMEN